METGIAVVGGGVLGHASAWMLKQIGYENPSFLAGTSVGSICVALKAVGKSWDEVYKIINDNVVDIFKPAPWWWRINPRKPKFRNDALRRVLKQYLGDTRMSDIEIPLFIPVTDFRLGKIKVYDNSDAEFLREVVLRSASAPTYFPPRAKRWADGGVLANDPTLVAISGMISKHGRNINDMRVLTIGTNGEYQKSHKISEDMSRIEWLMPIFDVSLSGAEGMTHFLATQLIPKGNYLRIEPRLDKEFAIDDPSIINEYEKYWKFLYSNNREIIDEWVRGGDVGRTAIR